MGTSNEESAANRLVLARADKRLGKSVSRTGAGFAAVSAAVLLLATACSSGSTPGGSSSTSSSSSGSGGATSQASDPNIAKAQAIVAAAKQKPPAVTLPAALKKMPDMKGKKVLIVPVTAVPFATFDTTASEALKKVGAVPVVCDGGANPKQIDTCLRQAKPDGAVGVISIGIPYELDPNGYDLLASQHIPALSAFQDPIKKPSTSTLTYEPSKPALTSALDISAAYVTQASGGKANALVLIITESPSQIAQGKAYIASIKAMCPNCKVTSADVSTAHLDEAAGVVSAALLRDPTINWVLPENADAFGNPVYAGLQSARATSKVKIGGPGGGVGALLNIKQGHLAFAVAAASNLGGWNAADGLFRMISGEPVPANYPFTQRLFDSSNVNSIALTPQAAASFDWFGTPTYQQEYLKDWHVS